LNEEALDALKKALARARSLGASEPDHFLFPFRANKGKRYDPTRHATTFSTAWRKLRVAAGLPTLRPYDLRHTVITNMLANPRISEKTIGDIVGHVQPSTKRKYSHIRRQYREQAVEALITKKYAMRERRARERKEKSSGDRGSEKVLDAIGRLTETLEKFIALQMAKTKAVKNRITCLLAHRSILGGEPPLRRSLGSASE